MSHVADHPLALELASLRSSLTRYQQEAHTISVQLQRHSFETSLASEKARFLTRENAVFREELVKLRNNPDTSPNRAGLQVNELTMALRRVSDKLDLTEATLLERTSELSQAVSERVRAKLEMESAYDLAARARSREEDAKNREKELEAKVKAVEAERAMVELVVQEYADLVRSLEGRRPSLSTLPKEKLPIETLAKEKMGKMFREFNEETSKLNDEISSLRAELATTQSQLAVEKQAAEEDRIGLAIAKTELAKHIHDDNTAAKLVSRYMRFSQASSNTLQTALETLKTRNSATLSTLTFQVAGLETSLAEERRTSQKLREALDELSEDIARETFGRRRETALRLALLAREQRTSEGLSRWVRRASEAMERGQPDAFSTALDEARTLLSSVDASEYPAEADSALARVLAAQDAVNALSSQLQIETEKRLVLEREKAKPETEEIAVTATLDQPLDTLCTPLLVPNVEPQNETVQPPTETVQPETETLELWKAPVQLQNGLPTSPIPSESSNLSSSQDDGSSSSSILSELVLALHRYDDLQRSFRDCHLTLSKLKSDLSSTEALQSSSASSILFPSSHNKPLSFLQVAVARLDDINEDARVELEIRIADEARLVKGYEALLAVPGAVEASAQHRSEVNSEIWEFIRGTSPGMCKVMESFRRKLDDIQHDIAQIKKALHEQEMEFDGEIKEQTATGNFQSPSPPHTFGAVMASSRLFHSKNISEESLLLESGIPTPYASLGLRIAMPQSSLGIRASASTGQRSRKSSAGIFTLGLGAESAHTIRSRTVSLLGSPMRRVTSESHLLPAVESKEVLDIEETLETEIE